MNPIPRSISRVALATALAAILAAPATVHAGSEQSTTAKTREMSPGINQMMERKAELGLTAEQEARLKQIREGLVEKNRPLVAQVESVIGDRASKEQMKAMSDSEREDYLLARHAEGKSHPELQPVYKQIRENRKAAWQEAKTVLNPDQQAKVEKWAKEKKEEMQSKGKANAKSKSKSKDASSNAIPAGETNAPAEQGK